MSRATSLNSVSVLLFVKRDDGGHVRRSETSQWMSEGDDVHESLHSYTGTAGQRERKRREAYFFTFITRCDCTQSDICDESPGL